MGNRVGGIITVRVDGTRYRAKGEWEFNLGRPKRTAVVGADAVHGYMEEPQVPFIAGAITDDADLDLDALLRTKDATVWLELANGKGVTLRDAWYAAEGTAKTKEGEIEVRFEGLSADIT